MLLPDFMSSVWNRRWNFSFTLHITECGSSLWCENRKKNAPALLLCSVSVDHLKHMLCFISSWHIWHSVIFGLFCCFFSFSVECSFDITTGWFGVKLRGAFSRMNIGIKFMMSHPFHNFPSSYKSIFNQNMRSLAQPPARSFRGIPILKTIWQHFVCVCVCFGLVINELLMKVSAPFYMFQHAITYTLNILSGDLLT